MKVTRAPEMAAYPIQAPRQSTGKGGSPRTQEKSVDQFTAAPYRPVQNAAQTADQVADALRRQYPGVSFTFTELGDEPEELAQWIASAGKGVHLVMDPDVLEWMAQGEEAWAQGMEMIGKTLHDLMLQQTDDAHNSGAVIGEDGQVTLWKATWEKPQTEEEKDFEFMKNALERLEEERKQQKLRVEQKKKLNYQMGRDMARLAKGTTDQDVRSLISSLYANRQRIASNSSYDAREVQMALAQIDRVIGRARAKIRHLREEGDLRLRAKRAQEQREEKRRIQLEQELKSRRRNRMAKERAGIYERMPDLPGLRRPEERALPGEVPPIAPSAVPAPVPPIEAGASVTISTPSGVQVTMTPMG